MNRTLPLLGLVLCVSSAIPRRAVGQGIDWRAVDAAFGRSGADAPDGVHRFSMPRTDLEVTVDGVTVDPGLALGSWIAMKPRSDGTVVAMGDLVLREAEIAPVMSRLQEGGITQTALHNHLLFDTPRVMYMHVHAEGDPAGIAATVKSALALTATPEVAATGATTRTAPDTAAIAAALGRRGSLSGGLYKVSAPRSEVLRVGGVEVGASMGLATAIGFQSTGGGNVVATGDFVLLPSEVNPVIRALREHGIRVTALHNHLLSEEPRLLFMHFWAQGKATDVARGLGAALRLTAVTPGA